MTSSVTAFAEVRPRLFGIAYRMLGSRAEAEDVVQDAWLRWEAVDHGKVEDATAFLVTTTTRLAINVAQSARVKREAYVGPWLPEPVDTSADPELGAERREALDLAVLLLLENLTPTERAAYVLREAFDYPHAWIGEVLQLEEANVRQLVGRAKKHLEGARRAPVSTEERRRLLAAFFAAAQNGDRAALEQLFAADVASVTDGGGAVLAARVPVVGREKVARFVATFPARFWQDVSFGAVEVNGAPAMLLRKGGAPYALAVIDASASGIERLLWIMNPQKLSSF